MAEEENPSLKIDEMLAGLADWRGDHLKAFRAAVREQIPELSEDWKWDTPVWKTKKNVVAAGVFKNHLKFNFFEGAALAAHQAQFNSGLDAKKSRGIDVFEGDELDLSALLSVVKSAVESAGGHH